MPIIQVKRGDIYYATLDPVIGKETDKTRPVLIIQNDIGNMYSPTTIVGRDHRIFKKKHPIPSALPSGRSMVLKKIQLLIYPRSGQLTRRDSLSQN